MELFIRTKDKEGLYKIDNVFYGNRNDYYWVLGEALENEDFEYGLGKYRSKKRCLEIIDEIQNLISPRTEITDENGNTVAGTVVMTQNSKYRYKTIEPTLVVYQMPKK